MTRPQSTNLAIEQEHEHPMHHGRPAASTHFQQTSYITSRNEYANLV